MRCGGVARGYPELHASELSQCRQSLGSLARHGAAGRAIYAECGGLLLLGQELVDADGHEPRHGRPAAASGQPR